MRIAALVFLGYALVLIITATWRLMPFEMAPDVVALIAVYLGLTSRDRVAPGMLGAVIIGYLADLLMGTPTGLLATTAGIVCLLGHLARRSFVVRGRKVTILFTGITGLVAALIITVINGLAGLGANLDLLHMIGSAALTGLVGPAILYLCRFIDSRFARTYRERDAALEGLTL